MDGKEVLWLPGTDHAGIATQVMVERQLKKEERKSRHDLGREEFLKRVWKWKEKHGDIIIQQLKKLGSSCDWSRERFTMDPEYSRCVQRVFVELYRKGQIYRGKRMVNWCPATLTALSDEEVDMEPQKGSLWHFKVEVAEEPGTFLTIATTRPETIPGDTGVAVNPSDPRYTRFIGKHAIRPLPPELPRERKLIPIVADEHVDFEFGTGVLKVTPAHDKADFEIGQRHKLAPIDIMNPDATMNDLAGADLAGLDRFEARAKASELLRSMGVLVKEEPYENKVGFSQRAKVPIEPRLSEQWFLKYPAVEQSKSCVADGALKFHPERWAKVYDHWLTNIQDWCISRQLWWGHQVPVWRLAFDSLEGFAKAKAAYTYVRTEQRERRDVIASVSGDFEFDQAPKTSMGGGFAEHPGRELTPAGAPIGSGTIQVCIGPDSLDVARKLESEFGFTQDPDVLDTWFSSWLWPFATMGWPGQDPTLKKFYPTTDLVTAPDIIFFWVARMIMAGYEFMGDLPFRNVYFTGLIRDKQGRKMSKTLGNSPDPLDLVARYGADALRFGTMRSAPLGQDVLFDEKDVELGRNFCNKLWNACRFRQMQGGQTQGEIDPNLMTSDDRWILAKLDQAIRDITTALDEYRFNEASAALYRFFWSEYCDWYLEASKATLNQPVGGGGHDGESAACHANTLAVIDFVLSHALRLFHPFLPFITEELWQGMGYAEDMPENQGGRTLMFAPWPKPLEADFRGHYGLDNATASFVNARNELVTEGRNLRRAGNVPSGRKARFVLRPASDFSPHDVAVLKLLLNAEPLDVVKEFQAPKATPAVQTPLGELFLPIEARDVAAEKARLQKELDKAEAEISKAEQKLGNPNFAQKAPPHVLEEHRKRLAEWQAKRDHIREAMEGLEG
jgi:valyl-tRNA synthetase